MEIIGMMCLMVTCFCIGALLQCDYSYKMYMFGIVSAISFLVCCIIGIINTPRKRIVIGIHLNPEKCENNGFIVFHNVEECLKINLEEPFIVEFQNEIFKFDGSVMSVATGTKGSKATFIRQDVSGAKNVIYIRQFDDLAAAHS